MTATTDFTIQHGAFAGVNQRGYNVGLLKKLIIYTDATVDAGDTIAINFIDHNITSVWGMIGFVETTDASVIAREADTCAVADGVITITIVAGTDDDPRTIELLYL